MNNILCIYQITNNINGKKYIGSTKHPLKRWDQHMSSLNNKTHHNIILQRAWNKYGKENFSFDIIEKVDTIDKLFVLEQKYIDENIGGYNIGSAGGGDNISKHPDRNLIIEKISKAGIKRNAKMTEEERKIMYGMPMERNPRWNNGSSIKYCHCGNTMGYTAKTCSSCRDRSGVNNPFYGKKHTTEIKDKLKKSRLGKPLSENVIKAISGENSGRFTGYYHTPWGTFPSTSQAEKNGPGMLSAAIQRICKNPDNEIKKIGNSKYLKKLGKSCIGKTYRELGFWYEPK